MNDIAIEQALLFRVNGQQRLLAHSSGFLDDWRPEAERLAAAFGERPPGVVCPRAVFAQPFGKLHVAVVQVTDQPAGEGMGPQALAFHFLIIPHEAYCNLWSDPFVLADRVPPAWHLRGTLSSLSWPPEPLPERTVQDIRKVLQATKTGSLPEDQEIPEDWDRADVTDPEQALGPALLGGVQILVDGGKLVFERALPDPGLVRGLWTLLPMRNRPRVWPASFAFSNALGFDVVVVSPAVLAGEEFPHYATEDQACEYPQGYYELNLQIAAESGNQADLDRLLNRRTSRDTLRLALAILVGIILLALALNWITEPVPRQRLNPTQRSSRAAALVGALGVGGAAQAFGQLPTGKNPRPNQLGKVGVKER